MIKPSKKDIQNKIITKAYELFKNYGYKHARIDDVANQLHISKKTLYRYFASKDEILAIGVRRAANNLIDDFHGISSRNEHPLINLSLIYYRFLEELYNMEIVSIGTINQYPSQALKEVEKFKKRVVSEFARPMVNKASSSGAFVEALDIDLFLESRFASIDELYIDLQIGSNRRIALMEIFSHLVVYQILGVCKEEQRKHYEEKIYELFH